MLLGFEVLNVQAAVAGQDIVEYLRYDVGRRVAERFEEHPGAGIFRYRASHGREGCLDRTRQVCGRQPLVVEGRDVSSVLQPDYFLCASWSAAVAPVTRSPQGRILLEELVEADGPCVCLRFKELARQPRDQARRGYLIDSELVSEVAPQFRRAVLRDRIVGEAHRPIIRPCPIELK